MQTDGCVYLARVLFLDVWGLNSDLQLDDTFSPLCLDDAQEQRWIEAEPKRVRARVVFAGLEKRHVKVSRVATCRHYSLVVREPCITMRYTGH